MFVEGIEILGTPIGTDIYIKEYVQNNCLKIINGGSFRQWDKNDYDLSVTRLQMPHTDGDFGLTPNVIEQTSAKVAMVSRFLGLVGSLPLDEQKVCLPNQLVHDPGTWTTPHLLQLKKRICVPRR